MKILRSYKTIIEEGEMLDEQELFELLEFELSNQKRSRVAIRLHQLYSTRRRQRERKEIEGRLL